MLAQKFNIKQFVWITLITSLWINASEVFRYFILVMPRVKSFFEGRSGIAEMDWFIFGIWGIWDTLLTSVLVFMYWILSRQFGRSIQSVLISSTFIWAAVFVIFWVASANMGLSSWDILWITLPLSWLEMFVGSWIASRLFDSKLGLELA